MSWLPHRHRVFAQLIAIALVIGITVMSVFLLPAALDAFSAGAGLAVLIATVVLLPPILGALLRPIARAVEKRLVRAAARRNAGRPRETA